MKTNFFQSHAIRMSGAAAFGILALQLSVPAAAQAAAAPPKLEKLEEPATPPSPQKARPAQRIIETRDRRGQINSVEVRDERGSYYVKPGSITSNSAVSSPGEDAVRAPQWKIFEFDMKRPGDGEKGGAAGTPSDAPARAR